jgi:hypothetical protein
MKVNGLVLDYLHSFLTAALDRNNLSDSHFTGEERTSKGKFKSLSPHVGKVKKSNLTSYSP